MFGCRAFVHIPNAKQTNQLSECLVPARYLGKSLSRGGDHSALNNGEIGVYRHAHFLENSPGNQIPCAKSTIAGDSEGVQQEQFKGAKSKQTVALHRSAPFQAQSSSNKAAIATQKPDALPVESTNIHGTSAVSMVGTVPSSFEEACSRTDASQWMDAMKEELGSLHLAAG